MKQLIEQTIRQTIQKSQLSYYRNPVIGYADAGDPILIELKRVVGPQHLLPQDILPGAKSILAFFLPFQKEIMIHNQQDLMATKEWAEVYIKTNQFMTWIPARSAGSVLAVLAVI